MSASKKIRASAPSTTPAASPEPEIIEDGVRAVPFKCQAHSAQIFYRWQARDEPGAGSLRLANDEVGSTVVKGTSEKASFQIFGLDCNDDQAKKLYAQVREQEKTPPTSKQDTVLLPNYRMFHIVDDDKDTRTTRNQGQHCRRLAAELAKIKEHLQLRPLYSFH